MLTPRGISVAAAGVAMWLAARILGSPGLEIVGIGLALLPFIAGGYLRWSNQPVTVARHLSEARVAPGTRVTVRLDVSNPAPSTTSFLLLEDRLPPALGRPARLVVTGVGARGTPRVSYSIVPQARGRYAIGPLTVDRTDAFGLSRRRMILEGREDLLVTPEIEDLRAPSDAASGSSFGSARSRQLLRSGEEYFTMRGYQEGDDLRRIHWPAVARTGDSRETRVAPSMQCDHASRRGVRFAAGRPAQLAFPVLRPRPPCVLRSSRRAHSRLNSFAFSPPPPGSAARSRTRPPWRRRSMYFDIR